MHDARGPKITPDLLLRAYASGIFPMAESATSEVIHWVEPEARGVLPLDALHVSRSLRRSLLAPDHHVTINQQFAPVVDACADRDETWINAEIRALYLELHQMGHAHSVEVFDEARLIGGVYGIALGGAFFGESMFSRRKDGSKIALVHLVARLRVGGFTLLDTQFITPHLARFGAVEISRAQYRQLLSGALEIKADFGRMEVGLPPQSILQRSTQTS